MPGTRKEITMKKSFVLIIFSLFLFSSASIISAEQDDYQEGLRYYQKHRYKESVRHLKAYAEKTHDPRAYYLIGYASYKLKDYTAAKSFFSDAYLIDPTLKASSLALR